MDMEIFLSDLDVPGGKLINSSPGDSIRFFSSYVSADVKSACFIDSLDILEKTGNRKAGLIFTPEEIKGNSSPQIICSSPRQAFFQMVAGCTARKRDPGIHPTAVVADDSRIDKSAYVGPFVSIGRGCTVDSGAVLESGVVLGDNVQVGKNSVIHGGVIVYSDVSM